MGSQPIRIQLGKTLWEILRENLVGNSCGTRRRGKSQFKKGSDCWKFSIWNRVMGANQSGSSLGKSCRKVLPEIIVVKCCGKFLQDKEEGKSQFKKGNDW